MHIQNILRLIFFANGVICSERHPTLTVHAEWWVINDTVMGGRSSSSWQLSEHDIGVFQGSVSLENNGGFASVRGSTPENAFRKPLI